MRLRIIAGNEIKKLLQLKERREVLLKLNLWTSLFFLWLVGESSRVTRLIYNFPFQVSSMTQLIAAKWHKLALGFVMSPWNLWLPRGHKISNRLKFRVLTLRLQFGDDGGGGGESHGGDGADPLLRDLEHGLDVRVVVFGVGVNAEHQAVCGAHQRETGYPLHHTLKTNHIQNNYWTSFDTPWRNACHPPPFMSVSFNPVQYL